MELINERYSGVEGEKNLRKVSKMINIVKYFLPILVLLILVCSQISGSSDLTIDNKVIYILSIILVIFSILLNMIITKFKKKILRFVNAIIIFIYMLLIISGAAIFILPLLFIIHIVLIYIYNKESKTREKITKKMDNKVINAFPKLGILFSLYMVPFMDVSINFMLLLVYIAMISTEIAYLEMVNVYNLSDSFQRENC